MEESESAHNEFRIESHIDIDIRYIYIQYIYTCAYGVIDMHAVKMCYQPSIVYNIIIVGQHISISQSGKSKCTLE